MGCDYTYTNDDGSDMDTSNLTCADYLLLTEEEQATALAVDSSLSECSAPDNATQGIIVNG